MRGRWLCATRLPRRPALFATPRCTLVQMIPVRDVVAGVVADAIRRAPLSPEKVAFAWHQAAGAAVARATTISLSDGVLRVRAPDRQWRQEIARATPTLLSRLEALLGTGAVRRIETSTDPL